MCGAGLGLRRHRDDETRYSECPRRGVAANQLIGPLALAHGRIATARIRTPTALDPDGTNPETERRTDGRTSWRG